MKTLSIDWSPLLLVGLVCGLIHVVVGIILYLSGHYFESLSSIASIVTVLLCIIFGIIWYRNKYMKDDASYPRILLVGIIISISIGIIYAIYNVISMNYFYPNFMSDLSNAQAHKLAQRGLSQAEIDNTISLAKTRYTVASIAFMNFIFLSIIGTVCSLVVSSFLKKKRAAQL